MNPYIAGLWRYPVKSLAGERLSTATVGLNGIPGDRVVWVRGPEGVRTSRRHYRLLGLHGTSSLDGEARINGHAWDSPQSLSLNASVARPGTIAVGDSVTLVRPR